MTAISTISEKSIPAHTDEIYLIDQDAGPSSKRLGLDRLLALAGAIPGGRLTLTTAVPVTTSDVSAASTIYYTPHVHDFITVFDGTRWVAYRFTEKSLALSGLTSGLPYDVYIYDNAGTLTLELTAWTNITTRATALTRLNGIYVKTGATTRRFLGTLYTTATTTTEDSLTKRFLWNMYNKEPRPLLYLETTDNWTYMVNTWRQARGVTTTQIEFVLGDPAYVEATVVALSDTITASINRGVAIGVDSTTTPTGLRTTTEVGGGGNTMGHHASWRGHVAAGYHKLCWLEASKVVGTMTWRGDVGWDGANQPAPQSGMVGTVHA